jgi:hypothetical protein
LKKNRFISFKKYALNEENYLDKRLSTVKLSGNLSRRSDLLSKAIDQYSNLPPLKKMKLLSDMIKEVNPTPRQLYQLYQQHLSNSRMNKSADNEGVDADEK